MEVSEDASPPSEHRLRLRPWLEQMLDSNCMRGLEWIDPNREYFKIPWKHRSKKDWDMEHIKVFMDWAKHTGKYHDGQTPDYVAMKTRLRCAFNKAPDIEEVKMLHSLKCPEPYKVYRFLPKPDDVDWKPQSESDKFIAEYSRVCKVVPMVQTVEKGQERYATEFEKFCELEEKKALQESYGADGDLINSPERSGQKRKRKSQPRKYAGANGSYMETTITIDETRDTDSTLDAARMLLAFRGKAPPSDGCSANVSQISQSQLTPEEPSIRSNGSDLIPLLMAPPRIPVSLQSVLKTNMLNGNNLRTWNPQQNLSNQPSYTTQFVSIEKAINSPMISKQNEYRQTAINGTNSINKRSLLPSLGMQTNPLALAIEAEKQKVYPSAESLNKAVKVVLKSKPDVIAMRIAPKKCNGVVFKKGRFEDVEVGATRETTQTSEKKQKGDPCKYARVINVSEAHQTVQSAIDHRYRTKYQSRNRKGSSGVTYSNHGNIMATGLGQPSGRGENGERSLAEETVRMREAYGFAAKSGVHCAVNGDIPPVLLPLADATLSLPEKTIPVKYEVRDEDEDSDDRGNVVLDLRVSPGKLEQTRRDHSSVLDLSLKDSDGKKCDSAPASLTTHDLGVLDLTLKRKAKNDEGSNAHLVTGQKHRSSLAQHAIWDLSKANKHGGRQSHDAHPGGATDAVDLRHLTEGSSVSAPVSPRASRGERVNQMTTKSLGGEKDRHEETETEERAIPGIPDHSCYTLRRGRPVGIQYLDNEDSTDVDIEGDDDVEYGSPVSHQVAAHMEVCTDEHQEATQAANQLLSLSRASAISAKPLPGSVTEKKQVVIADKTTRDLPVIRRIPKFNSSSEMATNSRQRLRPWLEAQINGGQIKGLEWIDRTNSIFKIPWKHGGKHDWSADDSRIFMEWAVHTGRYREGIDQEDYAVWKTRLRCAFNKAPDIQEIKDQTMLNTPEPYRVYQLINRKDLQRAISPSLTLSDSDEDDDRPKTRLGEAPVPLVVEDLNREASKGYQSSYPSDLRNIPSDDLVRPILAATSGGHTRAQKKRCQMTADQPVIVEQIFSTNPTTGEPEDDLCAENLPRSSKQSTGSGLQPLTAPNSMSSINLSSLPLTTPSVRDWLNTSTPDHIMSQITSGFSAGFTESVVDGYIAQPVPGTTLIASGSATPKQFTDLTNVSQKPWSADVQTSEVPTYEIIEASAASYGEAGETVMEQSEVQTESVIVEVICQEEMITYDQGNAFHVSLMLKNVVVEEKYVTDPQGCRVASVSEQSQTEQEACVPPNVQEVLFPGITIRSGMDESEQKIWSLLPYIQSGILFQAENGSIYATRLCQCGVHFISHATNGRPVKIARNPQARVKIFDFEGQFLPEVERYRRGEAERPSPSVYLLFGQVCNLEEINDHILIAMKIESDLARDSLREPESEEMDTTENVELCALDEFQISSTEEQDNIARQYTENITLQQHQPASQSLATQPLPQVSLATTTQSHFVTSEQSHTVTIPTVVTSITSQSDKLYTNPSS